MALHALSFLPKAGAEGFDMAIAARLKPGPSDSVLTELTAQLNYAPGAIG